MVLLWWECTGSDYTSHMHRQATRESYAVKAVPHAGAWACCRQRRRRGGRCLPRWAADRQALGTGGCTGAHAGTTAWTIHAHSTSHCGVDMSVVARKLSRCSAKAAAWGHVGHGEAWGHAVQLLTQLLQ